MNLPVDVGPGFVHVLLHSIGQLEGEVSGSDWYVGRTLIQAKLTMAENQGFFLSIRNVTQVQIFV